MMDAGLNIANSSDNESEELQQDNSLKEESFWDDSEKTLDECTEKK